jgi:hypothetical protein
MATITFPPRPGGRASAPSDYIDDAALTPRERTLCAEYFTVPIGHDRRPCWPAAELHGVLDLDDEP